VVAKIQGLNTVGRTLTCTVIESEEG